MVAHALGFALDAELAGFAGVIKLVPLGQCLRRLVLEEFERLIERAETHRMLQMLDLDQRPAGYGVDDTAGPQIGVQLDLGVERAGAEHGERARLCRQPAERESVGGAGQATVAFLAWKGIAMHDKKEAPCNYTVLKTRKFLN